MAGEAFDPDAFLAEDDSNFDPDAFLAEDSGPAAAPAPQPLAPSVTDWGVEAPRGELVTAPEGLDAQLDAEAERESKRVRLRAAFALAQQGLDEAAVLRVAKALGVPTANVRQNLPAFQQSLEATQDPDEWERQNPELARLVLEHPDMGPLVVRSKELGPVMRAWTKLRAWATSPDELPSEEDRRLREEARASVTAAEEARRAVATPEAVMAPSMAPAPAVSVEEEAAQREAAVEAHAAATARAFEPRRVLERDDAKAKDLRDDPSLAAGAITALARAQETARGLEIAALNTRLMWAEVAEEQGLPGASSADELRARLHDLELQAAPRAYGDDSGFARDLAIAIEGGTSTALVLAEGAKGAGVAGTGAFVVGAVGGLAATRSPVAAVEAGAALASRVAPAGFKVSSAWQTFQWESGSTFQDLRQLETEDGQRLTATEAAGGAVVAGLLKTGLELVSIGQQTKMLTGPLASQWKGLLAKDPSFRKMLGNLGREWMKSVVVEGSTEGVQNLVEQLTNYAAASLKDARLQTRPAVDADEVVQNVEAGAMAALALGGMSTPLHLGLQVALADESATSVRQVAALGELAKQPEVQASPEAFAAMVRQATSEDGGREVTALHVDAQAVLRFYQGKNQDEAASELDALLGENGAQRVAEAAVTGHRLEVPMEAVLGRWGASEVGQTLLQDSATTPEGMTLRERTPERMRAVREEARRIAAAAEKEAASEEAAVDAVSRVEGELRAAGYTAKEASTAGALWKHFWRVVGQRADMAPETMAQRMRATFNLVPEGPLVTDTAVGLSQRFLGQDVATPEGKRARETDFYVDTTTGLLNGRAFKRLVAELGDAQDVAAVSIEGVKYANDQMGGHQSGDALYRAAAQALYRAAQELGLDAGTRTAKVGGDFGIAGITEEELSALLAKANEDPVLQGFRLEGAVAASYRAAAKRNNQRKDDAEKAGARAKRGSKPLGAPQVAEVPPHVAEKVADVAVPSRLQELLAEMPGEEAFMEAFIDEATGLLNKDGRDAFLEAHPKRFMASIDMNLLKPYNRLFAEGRTEEEGEALADQVLHGFGRLIADLGGGELVATHVSGDEFTLHADDAAQLRAFLAELDRVARGATIDIAVEGAAFEVRKLTFGFGVGETVEVAEEELHVHKQQLEDAGDRSSDAARALDIARGTVTERGAAAEVRGVGRLPGARAEGEGGGAAAGLLEGEGDAAPRRRDVVSPLTGRKGVRPRFLGEEALGAALGAQPVAGQARRLTPALVEKSRAEIDAVRADIRKRRNPKLKAQAEAWLDYTLGGPRPRGELAPTDAMIKAFARDGFVDPEGFKYDEAGRSLERSIGGRKRKAGLSAADKERQRDLRIAFMSNVHGKTVLRQEGDAESARGFIEMPSVEAMEQTFRVFLNPSADVSTVAHESAHAFLGILQHLSLQPDTPQALKDDFAAALKWLGNEGGALTEEQQEKWARGFETYLFEGQAPSAALESVFTRFALWLRSIYRSIRSLKVELSPEIRGVFDRLLATEEEMAKHKGQRGPALSAETLGLSAEEATKRADEDFIGEAFATRKAMLHAARERLRETEAWWKEERKAHLRQAAEDYEELPARRARALLDGEAEWGPGQPVVLQRAAVEAAVGKTRKVRQAKEGTSPDEVAQLAGYRTGKAMLEAVLTLPEKQAWVEAQADARMKEAHPGVLEDKTQLAKLVADGFHRYAQTRIERELKELHRRTGNAGEVTPREALQEAARMMVARRTARRLDAGGALRAERAAAREKAAAALRGDWGRALGAARRELLNAFLYEELLRAREEREAIEERASELSKHKARARLGKASPVYRDAVDALLGAVGLGASDAGFDEGTLESLRKQLTDDGVGVGEWADVLLDELRPEYSDMTMAGLRHLRDALEQVATAARQRGKALVEGKRVDKEGVVAALVTEAASYLLKKKPTATEQSQTLPEKLRLRASAADGFFSSIPDMVRDLVNDDQTSTWWKAVVLPMREAKHREADLLRTVVKPILEAFDAMPADVRARSTEAIDGEALFPGHTEKKLAPRRRFELLMLALNAGNESNLGRLLEGRGITMEQLVTALNLLTPGELAWVQSVWDAMESLKAPSFALEERLTGLRPQGLEARPLALAGGTLRGGYFPAVYDRDASVAGERQAANSLARMLDQSYVRPSTPHSHLKGRAEGFSDVISLDPNIIAHHLAQAAHDIAFRETILSVGSLVMDPAVQRALVERLGPQKAPLFLDWVRDVGTMRGQLAQNALHPYLTKLRENMATGLLGWNTAVAMGDLGNFAIAVAATPLKAKFLGAGVMEVMASPREAYRVAFEKSGEFRTAQDTLRRDFHREMKRLTDTGAFSRGPIAWYKDHAFAFLEGLQIFVGTPVWHGAYRQALTDGKGELEAVRFAEDVWVRVFPQHSTVEAAGILRDKGFWGISTMFYGFTQRMQAAQRGFLRPLFSMEFWEAGGAQKLKTVAGVGGSLMGLWLASDVLGNALMGRGPEDGDRDDEEPENEALKWRNWLVRKLLLAPLAQYPLELAPMLEQFALGKRSNPRASLVTDAISSLGKAAMAAQNDPFSYRTVEALMRALAMWKGVPVSPFTKQGRFAHDVATGEKEPTVGGALYGVRENQPENLFKAMAE